MSENAQINVRKGNKIISRIFCNWGTPDVVVPGLQTAMKSADPKKPLSIADNILRLLTQSLKGTGWQTYILSEDVDGDSLDYRYNVDVSSKPWRVRQTQMPSYGRYKPDGSFDNSSASLRHRNPAVTRSFRIGGK